MKPISICISVLLFLAGCQTNSSSAYRDGFYVWHIYEQDRRIYDWINDRSRVIKGTERIRYERESTRMVEYRFNAYSCEDLIEHLTAEMDGRKISAVCKNPFGEVKKFSVEDVNELRNVYKL